VADSVPRDVYEPFGTHAVWVGRVVAALWVLVYGVLILAGGADRSLLLPLVGVAALYSIANELAFSWWRSSRRKTFESGIDVIARIVGRRFATNGGFNVYDVEFALDGAIRRASGSVGVRTRMKCDVGDSIRIRVRPIRVCGLLLRYAWVVLPEGTNPPAENS
jgi:hypothetical protein